MQNNNQKILEITDSFWSLIKDKEPVGSNIPFAQGDFNSNLAIIQKDIQGITKHWSVTSSFDDLRAELLRLTGLCCVAAYPNDMLKIMFFSLSELYHPENAVQSDMCRVLYFSILSNHKEMVPADYEFLRDEDKILYHLYRDDFALNKAEINGWGLSSYYLSIYNAIAAKNYKEINKHLIDIAWSLMAEYENSNRHGIEFRLQDAFPFEFDCNALYCLVKRKGIKLQIQRKHQSFYSLGYYLSN